MRLGLRLSAPILLATASLAAHADTFYYTFTGANVDNFSFSVPSQYGPVNGGNSVKIAFDNVTVDLDGVTTNRQVAFSTPQNLGGVMFTSATHAYSFIGPQLFTGVFYKPLPQLPGYFTQATLLSGTYALQEIAGDHLGFGTLVVTGGPPPVPSTVPEPSSLVLLGTGLAGTLATLRRKLRRLA